MSTDRDIETAFELSTPRAGPAVERLGRFAAALGSSRSAAAGIVNLDAEVAAWFEATAVCASSATLARLESGASLPAGIGAPRRLVRWPWALGAGASALLIAVWLTVPASAPTPAVASAERVDPQVAAPLLAVAADGVRSNAAAWMPFGALVAYDDVLNPGALPGDEGGPTGEAGATGADGLADSEELLGSEETSVAAAIGLALLHGEEIDTNPTLALP